MVRALILATTLLAAPVVSAQPVAKPKLLVVISVDQFSADLFAEYRGAWSGGMKRLGDGVVFPSAYQSHAATETCPGHSTLTSGVRPATSGIAANDWFGQRLDGFGEIYCVEDEQAPKSTHDDYTVSLKHLSPAFQTLGDRMKALLKAPTRVFAVAGKDRAATLLAGRNADQTWWYDWRVKGFTTYNDRPQTGIETVIPALKMVNQRIAAWIAQPDPAPPLPSRCVARIAPVVAGKTTIGGGTEALPRMDTVEHTAKDFRIGRALDAATFDLAESMITANDLGHGKGIDVLAIGASSTDYIGHAYGTEGPEMCAQLAALDARLDRLFSLLDQRGVSYIVMLSADHGGFDASERHDNRAFPAAQRATTELKADLLSARLAKKFGWPGTLIENRGVGGDYWFTPAVPAAQRAEAAQWLKDALEADKNPQIAAIYTEGQLATLPMPTGNPSLWSLGQRVRASFVPGRSGSIYIVLRHGTLAIPEGSAGYVATHGTPWDYDRRVPLLFWWSGINGFEQPMAVETVDILPTLAALIQLPVPSKSVDGRCLDLDPGPLTTCP